MATVAPVDAQIGDRSLFPLLAARAYCNHAAISPPSSAVTRAVEQLLTRYSERGVEAFPGFRDQRERLREKLARLIGASADEIALTAGTTHGISDIALSIPWQPGQRVLVLRGEFPTNVTPWQCAAKLYDLQLCWLDANSFADETGLARLERELALGLRLVAVSAVQFQSGLAMPLEQIGRLCHRYGAELFVDAIQALGVVPLSVQTSCVDYLACGSHKWLMGLEGCGFAYVKQSAARQLVPPVAGWLSHEQGESFLWRGPGHLRYDRPLKQSARVLESGTPSAVGFAALEASLDLLLQIGVPQIYEHTQRYHDRLEPLAVEAGLSSCRAERADRRSGVLSFLPPEGVDVTALAARLGERGVVCGTPDGHLRLSPHFPNSLEEVPFVAEQIREALADLSGR